MSMTIKYKVHDFAKDTGLKSTEIIELLNKLKQKERTHMALLDVEEVDYLLNHYTKQNAVDSFDKFLDDGKKAAEAKLNSVNEIKEAKYVKKQKEKSGMCPKCVGALVLRNGKYGKFYGCSNYPKCRYTAPVK